MDAHYYIDDKTPTGTCAVLVNSGDRSLVANLAAANKFVPSHLETERAKAMVESARFYYIASFFLTVSVDSILQIAKPAAESGKVCVRVCEKKLRTGERGWRECHVYRLVGCPVRSVRFKPQQSDAS